MSKLALRRLADGASFVLILIAAAAFTAIGMWPLDDGVAARMVDSAWRAEALRRFFLLASGAVVGGLLVLLGHLALYRLACVGSAKRAGTWALCSSAALLLVATAATGRFWVVRPWF